MLFWCYMLHIEMFACRVGFVVEGYTELATDPIVK